MTLIYIGIAILGACWGSFLNGIAWRLISHASLTYARSYCPACHHIIRWHDLIPGISWFILHGQCRHCQATISPLYPAIEIATAVLAVVTYMTLPMHHLGWYSVYASLLIVTIHTDFRYHAISPLVTIYTIPLWIGAAYWHITPISWSESALTAIFAYGLFAMINAVFRYRHGIPGIGEGDWELIATIASVIGFHGFIYTILGGSIITLWCIIMPQYRHAIHTYNPLPFGAGLACMAILYPLYTL